MKKPKLYWTFEVVVWKGSAGEKRTIAMGTGYRTRSKCIEDALRVKYIRRAPR